MTGQEIETPIAIFIYKRPRHTEKVLNQIQKINPRLLLVIGDGPKDGSEQAKCESTRELITQNEYPFEIRCDFASENRGLKKRFDSGLKWIFNQTQEAIILEDDTLPDPSFFIFCDKLLKYYKGDNRVWDITGTNHTGIWERDDHDYHFSYRGSIWGWATWKDSWEEYDRDMELWDSQIVRNRIRDVINEEDQFQYAKSIYDDVRSGEIETWDYQWGFARQRNNGLSVVPSKNLVKNIGFDSSATNTTSRSSLAVQRTHEFTPPVNHPPFVAPDREYDKEIHNLQHSSHLKKFIQYIS